MGTAGPRGVTLDAGALIAFERGDERVRALIRIAARHRLPILIPAGVLGQVWRDGARQTRLGVLVRSEITTTAPLDEALARAAGVLCGRAGTTDVIDATVVLAARASRTTILSSDADDMLRLDASLTVEPI